MLRHQGVRRHTQTVLPIVCNSPKPPSSPPALRLLPPCMHLCAMQGERPAGGEHILVLCNAVGSPVDSRHVCVEPKHLLLTRHHAIMASDEVVYVWQHTRHEASVQALASGGTHGGGAEWEGPERLFHVDDPAGSQVSARTVVAASLGPTYLLVLQPPHVAMCPPSMHRSSPLASPPAHFFAHAPHPPAATASQ